MKSKIHCISYIGPYLFGVGEKGTVIRSSDEGKTWTMSSFPTNATVWAITGRNDGFVCAHGKHCIYVSDDFGVSWRVAKPLRILITRLLSVRYACTAATFSSAHKYTNILEAFGLTTLNVTLSKSLRRGKPDDGIHARVQ